MQDLEMVMFLDRINKIDRILLWRYLATKNRRDRRKGSGASPQF
jgi:hypothetical protein